MIPAPLTPPPHPHTHTYNPLNVFDKLATFDVVFDFPLWRMKTDTCVKYVMGIFCFFFISGNIRLTTVHRIRKVYLVTIGALKHLNNSKNSQHQLIRALKLFNIFPRAQKPKKSLIGPCKLLNSSFGPWNL